MSTQKLDQGHSIDTRVALLEQSINNINDTMVRFEKRFDKVDNLIYGLYVFGLTTLLGIVYKLWH